MGSPSSGNFGHKGRPGEVGGSSEEGGGSTKKLPVPVTRKLKFGGAQSTVRFRKGELEEGMNTYSNEVVGYSQGETSGIIRAHDKLGRQVGYLDYSHIEKSDYDENTGHFGKPYDDIAIKMIEVVPEHRRKGIATRMRAELLKEYPGAKIHTFGDVLTTEGQQFEKSVSQSAIADHEKWARRMRAVDQGSRKPRKIKFGRK